MQAQNMSDRRSLDHTTSDGLLEVVMENIVADIIRTESKCKRHEPWG